MYLSKYEHLLHLSIGVCGISIDAVSLFFFFSTHFFVCCSIGSARVEPKFDEKEIPRVSHGHAVEKNVST